MMQQFMYTIQPTRLEMLVDGPTPEEAEIVTRHFNYLQNLAAQGILFLAGRTLNTDNSSFGIVILQADSEKTAYAIMENDPAVKNNVMQAKLYPYRIALTVNQETWKQQSENLDDESPG